MGDVGFTFERLPPERGGTAAPAAAAGSCCCCCCCCLHAVGGLLGAATAKPPKLEPAAMPAAIAGAVNIEPRHKVTREYWLTLLLLTAIGFPLVMVALGARHWDAAEMVIGVAIFLPLIQLAASVVVLVITSSSSRPGRVQRRRHLLAITLRAFIGGLIGIAVMAPLFLR